MEVACGYDAMAERCKRYNYMPTRKDVFEKDSFFSTDPMQQRFYKELQNGHARPASSIYPAISDINARMMGEVLIGNRTPEQAVDELQRLCLEAWQTWQRTQRKQN
jgi:multiple sugar transport system substrate-binding protein